MKYHKACVLIATVYLELSTKYLDQTGDQWILDKRDVSGFYRDS